ncbi:MAG: hypothetical protein M1817_003689 [Caeruleum heppii]|nr:MAG: hypothetical protein M1817_003689 [Caeruleum heppii]
MSNPPHSQASFAAGQAEPMSTSGSAESRYPALRRLRDDLVSNRKLHRDLVTYANCLEEKKTVTEQRIAALRNWAELRNACESILGTSTNLEDHHRAVDAKEEAGEVVKSLSNHLETIQYTINNTMERMLDFSGVLEFITLPEGDTPFEEVVDDIDRLMGDNTRLTRENARLRGGLYVARFQGQIVAQPPNSPQ